MKWSTLTLLSAAALVHAQTALLPCVTAITEVPVPCPAILCIRPTTITTTHTVTSTRTVTLPTKCPTLTIYPLTETIQKREAVTSLATRPSPCLPLTTTLTSTRPCPTCPTATTITATATTYATKIVPRPCLFG